MSRQANWAAPNYEVELKQVDLYEPVLRISDEQGNNLELSLPAALDGVLLEIMGPTSGTWKFRLEPDRIGLLIDVLKKFL